MIKPSKYLLAFAGLFVLLGAGLFITCQKYLPILLQHTVYYCQSVLNSFSIQIPGGTGAFLTGTLLLLIGFAVIKFLVSYAKVISFRKYLRSRTQPSVVFSQLVSTLGLRDKVSLVRNNKPFAFCHGIRHPKIYISTALFNMISASELEAILRHEKYHLEHKDPFIMLLAEIAKSLFPFFPLLSDLIYNYQIEREIKADHRATYDLGDSRPLVSVLKKLLLCEPIKQYAFAPALADHETLEIRIKALVKKDHYLMKFNLLNVFISIVAIGVFVVIVVAPVHAIEMHEEDSDVMMVCLQNDACAAWCRENRSVVPYSKTLNASYPQAPMTSNMSPAE